MISTEIDQSRDLTVFVLSGTVTSSEIVQAIVVAYEESPTRLGLWDVRHADFNHLGSAEIRAMVRAINQHGLAPEYSKTAVVVSSGMDFAVARTVEAVAEDEDLTYELGVFLAYDDALTWLDCPEPGAARPEQAACIVRGNVLQVVGDSVDGMDATFTSGLQRLVGSQHQSVVLDVSGIRHLGSDCVRHIALGMVWAKQRGVKTSVRACGQAFKLLVQMGVDRLGALEEVSRGDDSARGESGG